MQFRFALEAVGASVIYVDVLELKSSENATVMSYGGNSRNVFSHLIIYWVYLLLFLYTLLDIVNNYLNFWIFSE